jgi:hypothetical protein
MPHFALNSRFFDPDLERIDRVIVEAHEIIVLNPKSEVDRRHSAPSFGPQGLSALGAASLDAARFGPPTLVSQSTAPTVWR